MGKAIAARLAPHHHVVIMSPSEEKLKATATELNCAYEVGDVRDYAAMEHIVQKLGNVDCVINNAGLWVQGLLDENDPVRIHDVVDVNVVGVINLTKAVIPAMKQQKSGLIINIISQGGLYAKAERAVYTASKWAITGFTKSIQLELAPFGISVTGLYPGKLRTNMFSNMGIAKDMSDALEPDEVAKVIEFALTLNAPSILTEVGIKHIDN